MSGCSRTSRRSITPRSYGRAERRPASLAGAHRSARCSARTSCDLPADGGQSTHCARQSAVAGGRALRDNGRMRFLGDRRPPHDLTYADVFMVPSRSSVGSRLEVDLTTPDRRGDDDPGRRRQHDRDLRTADGRDRGPPRRARRPAAGHPGRRRQRGRVLDQVAAPGLRHPDHAAARRPPSARRCPCCTKRAHGIVVVVEDGVAGRRGHRRRLPGRRPLHPALAGHGAATR